MNDRVVAILRLGFVGLAKNIYRRYLGKLFLFSSRLSHRSPTELRENFDISKLPKFNFDKEVQYYDGDSISFFNNRIELFSYDTDLIKASSLEKFHVHYLDILNCKKYRLSKSSGLDVIDKYLKKNTDYLNWHPYTQSRQLINLLKFFRRYEMHNLPENYLNHLYRSYKFISLSLETHLMANHYFANLKALFFFECCYNVDPSRSNIKLINLIIREIDAQILGDGGHYELSPTYHDNFIDDMLDLLLIILSGKKSRFNLYGPLKTSLVSGIERCCQWSRWMSCDGLRPRFSDSSNALTVPHSVMLDKLQTTNLDTNWTVPPPALNSKHFKHSGYLVHATHQYKLVMDCGRIGAKVNPGHGHADIGACEISVNGKEFIINGGTASYSGAKRMKSRSTSNYSTYVSKGGSSSNLLGDFKVGREAEILSSKLYSGNVVSSFDLLYRSAYRNGERYIHKRSIALAEDHCTIVDHVQDSFEGQVQYIVSGNFKLNLISDNEIFCSDQLGNLVTLWCSEKVFVEPFEYCDDIQKPVAGNLIFFNTKNNKSMLTRIQF